MKEYCVYRDSGKIDKSYIKEFEEAAGYQFPTTYKNLITCHNALRLEEDCFDFNFEGSIDSRDISFYGFGEDIKKSVMITRKQLDKDDCIHENFVVFGCSSNGDYICFDYSVDETNSSPSIAVVLHDHPDDNNKMLVCQVAETFDDFMDSLYE